MRKLLTKDDVAKALKDLEAQGKKVTLTSLHASLGNLGSMSLALTGMDPALLTGMNPSGEELSFSFQGGRRVWDRA